MSDGHKLVFPASLMALQSHSGLVEKATLDRMNPLARFGGLLRVPAVSRGRVTRLRGNPRAVVVTLVVTLC